MEEHGVVLSVGPGDFGSHPAQRERRVSGGQQWRVVDFESGGSGVGGEASPQQGDNGDEDQHPRQQQIAGDGLPRRDHQDLELVLRNAPSHRPQLPGVVFPPPRNPKLERKKPHGLRQQHRLQTKPSNRSPRPWTNLGVRD